MNEIFNLEKLYRAYLDCRRTKRKTINALKFEWDLEKNLIKLLEELKTKVYHPGRSICFVITDPVSREIFAADFKDRIVHHLLVKEIEQVGEKSFIFDTFSCRKNKGAHLAVKRLNKFIRQATENYKNKIFYVQLDIAGFFMAINHKILFNFFKRLVLKHNKSYQWQKDILWLGKIIIFHKPTQNYIVKGDFSLFKLIPSRKSLFKSPEHTGLPIGNYSSQFFANLYLDKLDQFIKRELKYRYYVRYVDDFVLLDRDKEKLKQVKNKINSFLKEKLSLKLNLNKVRIQSIDKGIDFLGYFIKPVYTLVRQRVVKQLKNKLNRTKETKDLKKILAQLNSYYGHFKHAASFNLRKDIYLNHLGEIKSAFLPKEDFSFLKLR